MIIDVVFLSSPTSVNVIKTILMPVYLRLRGAAKR